MKNNYKDIVSRIKEKPKWWDNNGVPRYDDFHPKLCPDIYSSHTALILIACQGCSQKFEVEVSSHLVFSINELHYGDPPNIGCCLVGATMSSISLKTLQVWVRNNGTWERKTEQEGLELEKISDYFDD